jgi:hypothetical protein
MTSDVVCCLRQRLRQEELAQRCPNGQLSAAAVLKHPAYSGIVRVASASELVYSGFDISPQVRQADGKWLWATAGGRVAVFAGDMLQHATGGRIPAALHRVVRGR